MLYLSGGILAQRLLVAFVRKLDLTQDSSTLTWRRHQQRLSSLGQKRSNRNLDQTQRAAKTSSAHYITLELFRVA